MTNKKYLQFTGSEHISDILEKMPEAGDLLFSFGLGCAGCAMGQVETLRDGVFAHGFDEEFLQEIIIALNKRAKELGIGE